MSISPSTAYNIQNHGTDYNLATSGDSLATSNSRIYAWQATSCGSDGSVFLADTLAQKCIWANGTSVAVHSCVDTDKQWSVRAVDGSPDTYIIQSDVGNSGSFLSTNDDESFSLVVDDATSYAQWSFQAPSSGGNVTWNVCDHITGLTISSSSTGTSSPLASTTRSESLKTGTSSSLSTSNTITSATRAAPSTILETSISNEEQAPAEVTAAATAGSSNNVSSQPTTETALSASTQTPAEASITPSNSGHSTNVARRILLAALIFGQFATLL